MTAVAGVVCLVISDLTPGLRHRLRVLRAVAPGLVGGDHHVGGHEEGPVLCGWHNVVRLVPHPVVELPDVGGQGHGENVLQRGLGVTLDLTKKYIFKIN